MTGLRRDGTMFDYALHEVKQTSLSFHIEFLSTILSEAQQVSYMNVLQPMHIMINGEDAAGTKEAADFLRKLIKEQVNIVIHHKYVTKELASMKIHLMYYSYIAICRWKTQMGPEWWH